MAKDGQEAIARALELHPDVILMDLNMPKMSGIEATRRIIEATPNTSILTLTMFEDDNSIFAAMRAGAPRLEKPSVTGGFSTSRVRFRARFA